MKTPFSFLQGIILVITFLFISGCATTASDAVYKDPYEGVNRSILDFNLKADRLVLKPLAKTYSKAVPRPIRNGIGNFFSNLFEPMTVLNDLLQGKFVYAARDASRFLINSTVGVLGIFDVATRIDLPKRREDFGQTLAVWGVPSGPYLVLPFFGPSNLRDTAGLIPQWAYADPVSQLGSPDGFIAGGIRLVDNRVGLFGADDILELQPDKYLFLRENYRQGRVIAIHDGSPPTTESDSADDLIDQILEE